MFLRNTQIKKYYVTGKKPQVFRKQTDGFDLTVFAGGHKQEVKEDAAKIIKAKYQQLKITETDPNVYLRTHEGYSFIVPPGVSAIMDSAGAALLNIHKVESSGNDKFGISNGVGLPALFEATQEEWEKGGKLLAEVSRFAIQGQLIPRKAIINIALQRGISAERISEYQLDETIDAQTIAQEINELPVEEGVKYPVSIEDEPIAEDNQVELSYREMQVKAKEKYGVSGVGMSKEKLVELLKNEPVPQN